jgi:hypothetical protein
MTTLDQTMQREASQVLSPASPTGLYYPTERDAIRTAHIEKLLDRNIGPGPRTDYDSVVIVGAGFTASVMAARLARSHKFRGKVVLAGPRMQESRALKDGATLRGHGADYVCYALGVPQYAFVDAVYGDIIDGRGVGTRNFVGMAWKGGGGTYELGRVNAFQGKKQGFGRPLYYGARNSRMQGAMHELMALDGVIEVPTPVNTIEEAFALAPGKRPLIVNAGHNSGLLRGGKSVTVDWATSVVQAAFKVKASGLQHLESNSALVAPVRRGRLIDVGLFNPFGDPLSPKSHFYGIIVGQVSQRAGYDKQQELETITEEMFGIGDMLGLEVDDADETMISGIVPGSPWKAPQSAPGTLELQLIAHQGVSATFSDGMTTGAAAAMTAAEAVIRGADPERAARRAVREVTRDRRIWNFERNQMARLFDLAIRVSPSAAAAYPYTRHGGTTWASAA